MHKKISVYFYYLDVGSSNLNEGINIPSFDEFINVLSSLFSSLVAKPLIDRKYNFSHDEKVIWLDSFDNHGNGNYDLIFKSAKYNHVRNVIDTEFMQERGTIKTANDGDEEKTHLCIRHADNQTRFICMHENNYYGMHIERIVRYLNEKLEEYRLETESTTIWTLQKEIMVCEDFLAELQKMNKVSVLRVTIERSKLTNDFLRFAERDDIKDTIDISIKKVKRNKNIPKNLVQEYYHDMKTGDVIKRIVAEGSNNTGSIKLDTELIKMKHCLSVETTAINEVQSTDFFKKAQILLESMR